MDSDFLSANPDAQAVMACFEHQSAMSTKAIRKQCFLSQSKAQRLLHTLCERGYLRACSNRPDVFERF